MGSYRLLLLFSLTLAAARLHGQGIIPDHMMQQGALESSSRREAFDDLQTSAKYWYDSKNPANLPAIDAALKKILPEALKQAPYVANFQSWETAHQYKAYHDAGSVLLAKCYTLLYYGDVEKAKPCVELLTTKLPYSMVLYDNRTVAWTRQRVRYHEYMCAMYGTIVAKRMKTISFPKERDEFDGWAQRMACHDMAVLRLREGNYDAVERFAEMAEKQQLCTCSGDWVIDLIYNAMEPVAWEEHSDAAWNEMRDAIRTWQRKFPKSVHADIAEARFLERWAFHVGRKGDAWANFRERSDKGRAILEGIKPDSPAWYATMIDLMGLTGAHLIDIAKVFREGNDRFPEYTPLYYNLSIALARSGADGGVACAGVFHSLVKDGHPDQAARMLARLLGSGDLATVQARLDIDDIRDAIEGSLKAWPDSYELRSGMAFVAITLGQKDLARTAMQGMEGKWDRGLWEGREDLARQLCKPRPAKAEPLANALPR